MELPNSRTEIFTAGRSYRSTARVDIEANGHRISWPQSGFPVALDAAASTMLDFFDEPLEPAELAHDLVEALGMDPQEARRSVQIVVSALLESMHLEVSDAPRSPVTRTWYPLSASP